MEKIGILIIDDDEASQSALRHVLDSEGWKLRIVPLANQALAELASGAWSLIIANVALTGLEGPLFGTLRELALAEPAEGGKLLARVLFVVPELAGVQAQPVLERQRLPYVLKPFHLHDFLERISDLLLETGAIAAPIRRVRHDLTEPEKRGLRGRRSEKDRRPGRETSMFASREDYMMTEEEIAEFEKQEEEQRKKKKKKESIPL